LNSSIQVPQVGQITAGLAQSSPVKDRLNSASLFSQIFAARAETMKNQARFAYSFAPEVARLTDGAWEPPVGAFRREVERYGQSAEDVILAPEQAEHVREVLDELGLNDQQIQDTLQAATRDDGSISLRSILESVARLRQSEADNLGSQLPAGLTPQVLGLLGRLGLDQTDLDRISSELGDGSVSLRSLARILAGLVNSNSSLTQEDTQLVRSLLLATGLSQSQVDQLLQRHLNEAGALTGGGLVNLLREAAAEGDQGIRTARSGRLANLVAQMLEGAQVVDGQGQALATLTSEELIQRLRQAKLQAKQSLDFSSTNTSTESERPVLDPKLAARLGLNTEAETGQTKARVMLTLTQNSFSSSQSNAQADAGLDWSSRLGAELAQALRQIRTTTSAETVETKAQVTAKPAVQVSLGSIKSGLESSARLAASNTSAARMRPSVLLTQLSERLVVMARTGQSSVRLQLSPPDLGNIRVDLQVEGQNVKATVVADSHQVQQILGSHSSDLRQSLADQGFNLDQFEVLVRDDERQASSGDSESDQGGGQGRSGSGEEIEGLEAEIRSDLSRLIMRSRLYVVA